MTDLLPCPFCGSADVHHSKQRTRNDVHHWVTCHSCMVQVGLTPEEWNTRANKPAAPFDWKDVKPGMAFKHKKRGTVLHYVGPDMDGVNLVMQEGKTAKYDGWPESAITRAHEHDIEVKP